MKWGSFAGDPSIDLSCSAFSPSPPLLPGFIFVLQILFYFDIVFTTIFTIEIALKVKPDDLLSPLASLLLLLPVANTHAGADVGVLVTATNLILLIFQILGNADYVFTSIFTLEIILKVKPPEPRLLLTSCFVSRCSILFASTSLSLRSSLQWEEFAPVRLCCPQNLCP